jgi:beta-mannanase
MLVAGTVANAHWNAELSNFAAGLLDLQNSGVVVILRLFHELDQGWFWWGDEELSQSTQAALWRYTENYFEAQGIHNVLYEFCIIGGTSSAGYPGDAYIDLLSWDQYTELPGSDYVAPQYADLMALSATKPIAIAENDCSSSGGPCESNYYFDAQISDAESVMPNLMWINYWWGENDGAKASNPYWLAYMEDPYDIMRQDIPAGF